MESKEDLEMNRVNGAVRRRVSIAVNDLGPHGEVSVQFPVAPRIEKMHKWRGDEFNTVTYTAVTCQPDEVHSQTNLRVNQLNRNIEVAIVCTMYNEDEVLFSKSMCAVFQNVKYFCEASGDPDYWKKILVVIVSDGRAKANKRTLAAMSSMGCYVDGLCQGNVDSEEVTAHFFESTPQVCITEHLEFMSPQSHGVYPVQTLFVLKEKNARKINSHRWFFNGVCEAVNPKVVMLLDVGTEPTPPSFFRLNRAFTECADVGGACGEIIVDDSGGKLFNPIVAAQNFEYKMSNFLDKPLESVFGFIAVLPGAFSAYRFSALKGAPLDAYFKGEHKSGEASVSEANMYLAEDRILCFEIAAMRGRKWRLEYVKGARACTDAPDSLTELMLQRRRWINGSFFAALYSLKKWKQMFATDHTSNRKCLFLFQYWYNLVMIGFSWFNLGNFYLSFYFLTEASFGFLGQPANDTSLFFQLFRNTFLMFMFVLVLVSFGNRPQAWAKVYKIILYFFVMVMAFMLYSVGDDLYVGTNVALHELKNGTSYMASVTATEGYAELLVGVVFNYLTLVFISIVFADMAHLISSFLPYMLLLPMYVSILPLYAFCNVHDLTWGTKGETKGGALQTSVTKGVDGNGRVCMSFSMPSTDSASVEAQDKANLLILEEGKRVGSPAKPSLSMDDIFKKVRTRMILGWFASNSVLVFLFTKDYVSNLLFPSASKHPYMKFLFYMTAIINTFRCFMSVVYLVKYKWAHGFWESDGAYGASGSSAAPATGATMAAAVAGPNAGDSLTRGDRLGVEGTAGWMFQVGDTPGNVNSSNNPAV